MIMTTTIRSELENYLKRKGMTINRFAEDSEVNSGTISAILNGSRPIAMQQLDRITSAMGLPEGSLYELYVDECFAQSPNWRRFRPFLYRCAELNKLEYIQKVVKLMMDNLAYIPALFETAEDLFGQGKREAAAILYECVAESEKYQHSERLALCQYRLFTIAIGQDQQQNLRAAAKFESFVERLDVMDQLDALKDLANMYVSLQQWDKLDETAELMGRKAIIQYNLRHKEGSREAFLKDPKRPLFMYIVYSYLLRSAVCDEYGDYEQALKYVAMYSDLSWVKEDDEEARIIKARYKVWSTANTYLYKLMMGQVEVLPDYVAYIETIETEIFTALLKIIQAANRFDIDIDDILNRFSEQISLDAGSSKDSGPYTDQVAADQYTRFMIELAYYHLKRERYEEGIETVLDGLWSAVSIYSEEAILKCVKLFEQYRPVASIEAQHRYNKLISEVQKK